MVKRTLTEFLSLGRAIAAARLAAGMAKQSDLASTLGVSQQTVSRWEAGIAKPREKQLISLALLLKLNAADLRRLAGDESPLAVSFVEPFPVDRLPAVTFEQFVTELVLEENPGAEVRRAGATGHTQDGLDVEAILPNGQRIGLQCKRVQRFGPADAEAAIAAFPKANYEKILVLSRIVSPQTAETVRSHSGWKLWDKDDLSRRVRRLPMEVQERLVDIYFRGQRQALLGRSESGPWLKTDEFFRPFDGHDVPLSHSWDLLGRANETADLLSSLVRPGVRMVLVVAAGGMGKSRLLKEVMATFSQREPSMCVRFLSGASNPTRQTLDDLGSSPKVLVVDDAHDRDGLGVLFEYAADPSRQTQLILATRNYALDRIRNEAAGYNIVSSPEITLGVLSREQLRMIAKQILAHFEIVNEDLARYIVAASGDSPMIVAMAAQVLARDRIPVELAKNTNRFRRVVLAKFWKVSSGHLGNSGDEKLHSDVLNVLALVQPFHPQDPQLLSVLEKVQGVPNDAASAVLARFTQGGIIFRRGHQWRLMPDVLGDYLIETSCSDNGRLTPFAHNVLASVKDTLLKHAMVNLGRLDWRQNSGDTAESDFLSRVWSTLHDIEEDFDPRLDAVKSVALYQPRQALEFVIRQARRGKTPRSLPAILNGIARTSNYLKEVLKLLWEIGRLDDRELGPNPMHPIRVLTELGGYDGHKPIFYCEALLDFGLRLSDNDASWGGRHTPLDILKPLLSSEGTNNSSTGRSVILAPYFINYEVVRHLRIAVIDKVVALLRHKNVAIARLAGGCLESAIRYPFNIMGSEPLKELRDALSKEFAETLGRVRDTIKFGVHPMVALAIARSVSWHANYGPGKPAKIARDILENLPNDLEFRLLAALVDGWGQIFVERKNSDRWQSDLNDWLAGVVSELEAAQLDPCDRLAYLEQALVTLKEVGEEQSSSHMLVRKLVDNDHFARALIEDALNRTTSLTRAYAGDALGQLMRQQSVEGRAYARRFIGSGDRTLTIAAALAYAGQQIEEEEDKAIVKALLSSSDVTVVTQAIQAVWLWQADDEGDVLDLLLGANLGGNAMLIDRVAMALCGGHSQLIGAMTEEDAKDFLQHISLVEELSGYWIDEVFADFSFRFPYLTADFFMKRVEIATQRKSFSLRPTNFGPYSNKPLRFLEANESLGVLEAVWRWLRQNRHQDHYFQYAAAHMFEAMFLGSINKLVEFFRPMLPNADADDLKLMGRLLREADHDFVFDQVGFVIDLLERCQAADFDLHREISEQLYCAAVSGSRSGLPGEPMPRDLADKKKAEDVLASLSRLSPGYGLFDSIKKSAISHIEHDKLDAEEFDE
jgi:transcriptional regulator with XRE-family HTH domain